MQGNVDIIVASGTKLDDRFPHQQFAIEGYELAFRLDRNGNGSGILIYVRGDIPCREIENGQLTKRNLEEIFLELNLRKHKVLPFAYTTTVK